MDRPERPAYFFGQLFALATLPITAPTSAPAGPPMQPPMKVPTAAPPAMTAPQDGSHRGGADSRLAGRLLELLPSQEQGQLH